MLGLVVATCSWATACGSENDPADQWRVTAEIPSMHDTVGSLTSAGGYLWFDSYQGLMVFDPAGDCGEGLCHLATHTDFDVTVHGEHVLTHGSNIGWGRAEDVATRGLDATVDVSEIPALGTDRQFGDIAVGLGRLWVLDPEDSEVRSVAVEQLDIDSHDPVEITVDSWPAPGIADEAPYPMFRGGSESLWITQGTDLWSVDVDTESITTLDAPTAFATQRNRMLDVGSALYTVPWDGGLVRITADGTEIIDDSDQDYLLVRDGDAAFAVTVRYADQPTNPVIVHRLDEDGAGDPIELDLPAEGEPKWVNNDGGLIFRTAEPELNGRNLTITAFDPRTLEPAYSVEVDRQDRYAARETRAAWHGDDLAVLYFQQQFNDDHAEGLQDPLPGSNRLIVYWTDQPQPAPE